VVGTGGILEGSGAAAEVSTDWKTEDILESRQEPYTEYEDEYTDVPKEHHTTVNITKQVPCTCQKCMCPTCNPRMVNCNCRACSCESDKSSLLGY